MFILRLTPRKVSCTNDSNMHRVSFTFNASGVVSFIEA